MRSWGDGRRFSYAADDLEITLDLSAHALTAHVYQRDTAYESLDLPVLFAEPVDLNAIATIKLGAQILQK